MDAICPETVFYNWKRVKKWAPSLTREEYFLPKVATLTQEGQKYSHYITQLQVQPLINLSNTCPLRAILDNVQDPMSKQSIIIFQASLIFSHIDSETPIDSKFNINLRQESSFSILGWTSARRGDIYQQSKVSTRSNWYEPGKASRFLRKLFLPCWFVLMSCK